MDRSTTLVFPNLQLLWACAQALKITTMEIHTGKKTLVCECREADIQLAIEKFRAELFITAPSE